MLFKIVGQPGRSGACGGAAGIEFKIRDFPVQRAAFAGQSLQHRFAIARGQQRAAAVAIQPLQLAGHADHQVHHEAAPAHQPAVADIKDRAAAGRHHLAAAGQHILQRCVLPGPEPGLALTVEDHAHGGAGAALDLAVQIHELHIEVAGQAAADRGFSRAHRTHQDEVACIVHAGMLTARG